MTEMMTCRYSGISYDKDTAHFDLKDGEVWIGLEEKVGMQTIVQEYQDRYLNKYEAYTIHKMFFHTCLRERQNAKIRLKNHFEFLRAFDCEKQDITQEETINRQDIIETVNKLWLETENMKKTYKNTLYDSLANIVKRRSMKMCSEMNCEIVKCLRNDHGYRQCFENEIV